MRVGQAFLSESRNGHEAVTPHHARTLSHAGQADTHPKKVAVVDFPGNPLLSG